MPPQLRNLYEHIKHHSPELYEHIRDIDTTLAELHLSGMILQQQRRELIEQYSRELVYRERI